MRILILLSFTILGLAACKNDGTTNQNESTTGDTTANAANEEAVTNCYVMVNNGDTTNVTLMKYPNGEYTGQMDWKPREKDGASGALQRTLKDGRLVAQWAYTIEGSDQVEEVHFTFDGGKLNRHHYQLEEKDGVLRPTDPTKPVSTEVFAEVPCN